MIEPLSELATMGAGGLLLALALCYPVIKTLHELAHGYAAKTLGCEVREIGVLLLVLVLGWAAKRVIHRPQRTVWLPEKA